MTYNTIPGHNTDERQSTWGCIYKYILCSTAITSTVEPLLGDHPPKKAALPVFKIM